MMVEQVTVFLQNEQGRLKELTNILAQNNINISALSVAETAEYGVMRMLVSDSDKALVALKEANFSAKKTRVIFVRTPDAPGALARLLDVLVEHGINVSYMYGYSSGDSSNLILKVSDPEKASEIVAGLQF